MPTALNLESGERVEDLGFYICWVILTTLCCRSVMSNMEEILQMQNTVKKIKWVSGWESLTDTWEDR